MEMIHNGCGCESQGSRRDAVVGLQRHSLRESYCHKELCHHAPMITM